ncbi:bis(5'-nucleosyl)-tetraphosphatase PrpE [Metabacillus herbersteinensis]|uniref:Bis(5'-nucleosyl)-tetraphosphatase PrpE n=1 Tax=Metabacillus herbersteinensis TaxID=283816 RepID=A0ABV6GE47_9BACI
MKVDVIGDVHGCYDELYRLTSELGYSWETCLPVHPDGHKLSFVGDLTDRGPQSIQVIKVVVKLIQEEKGYYSPGNHCNKLYRYFLGNKVQVSHGLETTVAEYQALSSSEQKKVSESFRWLYEQAPLYQVLDNKRLVVAHAGIREDLIGKNHKRVKKFVLYGDITGKTNPDGTPERLDWAKQYQGKPLVIYGHTPVTEPRIVKNTVNIDTGAVFGGKLTAYRYPKGEMVSVASTMPYEETRFRESKAQAP